MTLFHLNGKLLRSFPKDTHVTLNPAAECSNVSLSLESWHDLSCQSKCESLDVVCHFLWAGVATVRRFKECGKNQRESEERKCVFISVGGAWFQLWSVCGAAPGSPCKQPKPWGHNISLESPGMRLGNTWWKHTNAHTHAHQQEQVELK